jgi:DegV family protein with EDD domain
MKMWAEQALGDPRGAMLKGEEMAELPRRRVAVVTDSTSDLPRDLAEKYDIHVIPQTLIMGSRTWRDGVDIHPAAFYELLRTSPHFPSTSQATAGEFEEFFREASRGMEGVVAVLVSGSLSGTINSALVAVENLPGVHIEVVDSRSASMQQGFIALAAGRAAAAGGDLPSVAEAARSLVGKVSVIFVVDTLEYLHRGGRIGAAARLVGTMLNLKPVLELTGGVVQPIAKIRSRRKALDKLYDLVAERVQPGDRLHMAVLHVATPEEGQLLADEMEARFHPVEMVRSECGPVIGAHVGPGTVGAAFYVE